ncbi:DUF6461 domain-containing protein [Nocardioides sp. Root190]|uniref:DUF6461 domain-containing protein n=1 Tax=Nocardioides sp. Root190 TaxID=1736488 RepID=UPI0012FC17ED|nr:DUF6461 domain-containing protein [Nocardioides sp. Root190]
MLVGAAALLTGCGDQEAPSSSPSSAAPAAMGEEQVVADGLVISVSMESIGGDGERAWLNVMVNHDNRTDAELPLDAPELRCAQAGEPGRALSTDDAVEGSGGRSVEILFPLDADGTELRHCQSPAYVEIGTARWELGPDELSYVNAELARDPGRAYSWVATDGRYSSGYQVVFVPGLTTDEAVRILDPARGAPSEDDFDRVVVAEHEDGVVLFTYGYLPDLHVRALSRNGLAASYGNTVNGDDHVLVARDGKIVRSFDPFLAYDHLPSRALPEEMGLDLEEDTGPASWTLLERLTDMHVTQEWLESAHPAYLMKD